jgi:poly-beta-1,6-N-acetyl-D-glucosamine synthase
MPPRLLLPRGPCGPLSRARPTGTPACIGTAAVSPAILQPYPPVPAVKRVRSRPTVPLCPNYVGIGMQSLRHRDDLTRRVNARVTGTSALFRAETLRHVARARADGTLPGGTGVYDVLALTEDNELTLALKTLGYRPVSPERCKVVTEVMPTMRMLWKQRTRWQRGALDNLRHYGLTRTTLPYILRQFGMAASVLAFASYVAYTAYLWTMAGRVTYSLPWLALGLVFAAERVVTVRKAGWLAMVVAFPLVIELAYDVFQHVVYVTCVAGWLRRGKTQWGNLNAGGISCTES